MPNKFQNIQDFGGANISAVPDNIPDIDASDCDSIDFHLDGSISVNSGKISLDTEVTDLSGATTNLPMYLFKKSFGRQKEILVRVARIASNYNLQWYTGTRFELMSLENYNTRQDFGFANGNGDGGQLINRLFMSNGYDDVMFWNGATAKLVSVTANTIVADTPLTTEGFELNAYSVANHILINGMDFVYTGISGSTFTGVTPNPQNSWNSTIFINDGIVNPPNDRLMDECVTHNYNIAFSLVGTTGNNITRDDAGGDFSADGYQLGQKIYVTGFTDTNNNGVFTVKTVTNTTITFDDGEGVLGSSEAKGNYITVTAGVPKGNILLVDNSKLYVSGIAGQENTIYYSVTNQMTNFAITTDAKLTDGGYTTILPGGSRVTALYPRGGNRVIVHKNDGIFSWNLLLDSSNKVYPELDILAMGNGVGARNPNCIASYDKSIYYFNVAGELKQMEQSVYSTSTFNFDTIVGQLQNIKIIGTPYLVYDFKKNRLVLSCNIQRYADSSTSYSRNYLISIYIKQTANGKVFKTSFDQIPLVAGANNIATVVPIVFTSDNFTNIAGGATLSSAYTPIANQLIAYPTVTKNCYFWGNYLTAATNSKPYWVSKEFTYGEPAQDKLFDKLMIDGFIYGDTKIRVSILYGVGGKDGTKHYVLDKNSVNGNDEYIVETDLVSAYDYELLGHNSIFNDYDFNLYSQSYYFKLPLHIDIFRSDRFRIRIETYTVPTTGSLANTWWALNNLSLNTTLQDIDYIELVNQNETDGAGVGTDIIDHTNVGYNIE